MPLAFSLPATGTFAESDVRASWTDQPVVVPAGVERLIAESWAAAETEALQCGRELFPGAMTRLLQWSTDGGTLTLTLGPTDYRQFVGTNLRHPELAERFGRDALANPLGISVAVVTADNQLLVQQRSERVFEHPGFFHVCGGNVEPADVAGPDAPGVFAAARRELEEELAITPAQIISLTCLGLAENRKTFKPDLLIEAEVTQPADAFRSARNAEFSNLIFLEDATTLAGCLTQNRNRFTPPGMASLLVTGRKRYGDRWYQSTLPSVQE